MSRGVDEVQPVSLAVQLVIHLYGVAFDSYAAFALQIHIVQHLPFGHFDGFCTFKQTVCQCAFAVVDMGNDAKVTDILHLYI